MVQQIPLNQVQIAVWDTINSIWVPVLGDADGFIYPAYLIPQRNAPAANTAAVVTIAAVANQRHYLGYVVYNYSAAPSAGIILIEDGAGTTVYSEPNATGPVRIFFPQPLRGSVNTAMVITVPAGGAGISGILNIGSFSAEILIPTS